MERNYGIGFTITLLALGLVSIFVYCLRVTWWKDSAGFPDTISWFGSALLIAGSALTTGCLVGFIFGIPRLIADSASGIKNDKRYIGNDNLAQVSDWLTKIIVGVGLTNLSRIPAYLKEMGEYLGDSLGGTSNGEVAAITMVLYFLICGFLLAYLWTRLTFGKMLEDSEQLKNLVQ